MAYMFLKGDTRTANGVSDEKDLQSVILEARGIMFCLDITDTAELVGDTLDVYIQQKINGVWDDLVHFPQVLGNGGAKNEIAIMNFADPPTSDFHEVQDGVLAANSLVKGPIMSILREKHVIAGGAGKSFVYGVNVEIFK